MCFGWLSTLIYKSIRSWRAVLCDILHVVRCDSCLLPFSGLFFTFNVLLPTNDTLSQNSAEVGAELTTNFLRILSYQNLNGYTMASEPRSRSPMHFSTQEQWIVLTTPMDQQDWRIGWASSHGTRGERCLQGSAVLFHHTDFDDGQICSAVTHISSFNQERPHEFMLKRPSQDNLEGVDDVAEELESREVLSFPKKKSRLLSVRYCCV